jgi:hypothetical protein
MFPGRRGPQIGNAPVTDHSCILMAPVRATTATNATKCLLDYHPRSERPQSMPLRVPSLS